ncbi:MAG: hypothetical protein ACLU93_01120 [Streptococcus sp.]
MIWAMLLDFKVGVQNLYFNEKGVQVKNRFFQVGDATYYANNEGDVLKVNHQW